MRLLIIGNLEGYFGKASQIATAKGATVRKADNISIALDSLRSGHGADLLLVDVQQDIASLVISLKTEHIFVPVIACGIKHDKKIAADAIYAGAKEYIPLPPDEELISAIFESITSTENNFTYTSNSMRKVIEIADQVASSDATILITGKSGTGKEVMARYLHQKSKRKDKAFICINCAAIPDNLLESELFGYEKGSFTGAIARRIGKFEESNNGTLLLDEISEIELRLQAKLLRAIQEQQIDRIGGNKPINLNLRIIATSNRDLKKEVAEGRFREDLYFRLNIINLELPTLIERKEDIEYFASYFTNKYCKSNGFPLKQIIPEALEMLKNYHWPGNIREFENTIYRAVLLSKNEFIEPFDLKIELKKDDPSSLDHSEKNLIMNTLKYCIGDYTQAANILGISIKSLRNKIESYEREHELA